MTVASGCVWLAHGGAANAFFPPLPLGTGPVTVIPTPTPVIPSASDGQLTPVPPVPAPPFVPPPKPPPPPNVPQDTPNPPHSPQTVPEPASVVSALAGLATVAAAYRRKKSATQRRD